MFFKIPSDVVKTFLYSETEVRPTSDPAEVKIKSIYTQDKKFKCYINLEKFQFCDFKAGASGSCYSLFRDMLNLRSNKEVVNYLMKNYGNGQTLDINKEKDIKTGSNTIEIFKEVDKPIFFYQKEKIGDFGKKCLKYLLSRKVPIEYIKKLGYVYDQNSKFNKRIILPYFEDNRMVYFQARSIDKNNPLRYLNPAGLDTKNFVFNYDSLNDESLIICEGIFDAMSIDPNEQVATCMCSGDLSSKQLTKIFNKAKPKKIIYVPDQDETGLKKMEENIKRIYTYADYNPKVLIFTLPEGCKDLNDMLVNTGKNYILEKDCINYNEYKKPLFIF